MAIFKPYKAKTLAELINLPIKDGQIIYVTGDKKIYLDVSDTERVEVSQDSVYEKIIAKSVGDTDVALDPGYLYIFPEMEFLNISLKDLPDNDDSAINNAYSFIFTSNSKDGTQITLPSNIQNLPKDGWNPSPGVTYKISIINNIAFVEDSSFTSGEASLKSLTFSSPDGLLKSYDGSKALNFSVNGDEITMTEDNDTIKLGVNIDKLVSAVIEALPSAESEVF